jgi:hypothetical protein
VSKTLEPVRHKVTVAQGVEKDRDLEAAPRARFITSHLSRHGHAHHRLTMTLDSMLVALAMLPL